MAQGALDGPTPQPYRAGMPKPAAPTATASPPTVDADAHVNENPFAWVDVEKHHPGWLGVTRSGGHDVLEIEGRPYPQQVGRGSGVPVDAAVNPAAAAGAGDVSTRIADMDAEGIDIQVLYGGLIIGATGLTDSGLAADVCTSYNTWLLDEICSHDPARLKAVAAVPLQDPARAIAELERAVGAGAVGVTIPPALGDLNLDDDSFLPFFEAAAGLDTAVAVHGAPGMHIPLPAAGRFDNYAQVHTLSFPCDQMVAFTALAMGGVFDHLPDLRVAFLESGIGWVPFFVGRMDEHHHKQRDLLPDMACSASELIERGQCYFSFECEEALLEPYVEHLGSASLVFASDYPHWDGEFPGAVDAARERTAPFGDAVTAAAMGGNALRLYGLS